MSLPYSKIWALSFTLSNAHIHVWHALPIHMELLMFASKTALNIYVASITIECLSKSCGANQFNCKKIPWLNSKRSICFVSKGAMENLNKANSYQSIHHCHEIFRSKRTNSLFSYIFGTISYLSQISINPLSI